MLKRIALYVIAIFIIAIIVIAYVFRNGVEVVITESEIQSAVYKKFPIEKTHFLVLRVDYTDPIVELIDNSERVRFGITITPQVEVNGKKYSGSAIASGGFRYEPGVGNIYLTGFTIESLSLDRNKTINTEKLSSAISDMLENIYSKYPIYTLGDDLKQATAKMLIRKVTIKHKTVTILLGP